MVNFYLYGGIDENTTRSFNKLVRDSATIDVLNIYICSIGGDIDCACAIIDTINHLKNSGVVVNTFVDGKAWSAAAVIFCFGTNRIVGDSSVLMYHSIYWDSGEQNVYDFKSDADFIDSCYRRLIQKIVTNCNLAITEEYFYDKCRTNWWLDSKSAIEHGFATERRV